MTYGEIYGVPQGATFRSRRSLYDSGIHRDVNRAICGSSSSPNGAESVLFGVRSPEDIDLGELIYFAGEGKKDHRGLPLADQEFIGLNSLLERNIESRQPVRLVRAIDHGFSYNGMYYVEDAIFRPTSRGFRVCQFRLRGQQPSIPELTAQEEIVTANNRVLSTHYRLLRNSKVPEEVKRLYKYRCQVCNTRIDTLAGPYSEGAHIVPLGGGANGPDIRENVLSLCPNHHVMLDHGSIFLSDDWAVKDRDGRIIAQLAIHPEHGLQSDFARRHRELMGFSDDPRLNRAHGTE